nr:hypothetical protein [Ancylobacter tetraedralis]
MSPLVYAGITPVYGESNVLGVSIATQREPSDFDKNVSTVTGIGYTHTFDNNVVLDSSIHYFDLSGDGGWRLNSQAGLGYRHEFSNIFSIVGIASIGSRAQSNDVDFPYYSIHGSVDWKLTDVTTWSVVTYRYRNAFNADYDFVTPALGSALNFRLSTSSSISFNYLHEWENGKVADNLIGIAYQYHF